MVQTTETSPPAPFTEPFDETRLTFDLREGSIWNAQHTRICLAPADMLAGICRGIRARAGTGWRAVLKKCGQSWGRRVAERLDHECQDTLKKRVGELPLEMYLKYMSAYFSFSGWGTLEMDLALASRRGIVQARLRDSIFAAATTSSEPEAGEILMADPMIEGLLAAMLSYISGRELACVQTACAMRGAEQSLFLISAPARIAPLEARVRAGMSHEEIISLL
ncbi:MAG: hypothetical protein ACAI35_16850 [Candidatus Methylacidiphilales bacterium]|nr:hypothetical protein [Candidatus Methylacidiphilales bacterium]